MGGRGGLIVAREFSVHSLPFPKNYALVLFIGFAGPVVALIAFWFIKEPPSPLTGGVQAVSVRASRTNIPTSRSVKGILQERDAR